MASTPAYSVISARTIQAPRPLVFRAWTDADQLLAWQGPAGGAVTQAQSPASMVQRFAGGQTGAKTVTFALEEHGMATRATVVTAFDSPESLQAAGGREAAQAASDALLGRLAAYLELHAETFVIRRQLAAAPAQVFGAWTDVDKLAEWFAPPGVRMSHSSLVLAPGGRFHYALQMPDGSELWGIWALRDVLAPDCLVFISAFSNAEGALVRHAASPDWPLQTLSTVSFEARDGGTLLTMCWQPLGANDTERATFRSALAGMTQGWTATLDQLATYLAD